MPLLGMQLFTLALRQVARQNNPSRSQAPAWERTLWKLRFPDLVKHGMSEPIGVLWRRTPHLLLGITTERRGQVHRSDNIQHRQRRRSVTRSADCVPSPTPSLQSNRALPLTRGGHEAHSP